MTVQQPERQRDPATGIGAGGGNDEQGAGGVRGPDASRGLVLLISADAGRAGALSRALHDARFEPRHVATVAPRGPELTHWRPRAYVVDDDAGLVRALATIRTLREHDGTAPIIVLSRDGTVAAAVDAVKAGATDVVVERNGCVPLVVTKVRDALDEAARRAVVRRVFVGREAELAVLEEAVERVIAGEGRVVLVTGEEGIGKTSLALELMRRTRSRGCIALAGQCAEGGGAPPYWPWVQIIRRYVAVASIASLRDDLGEHAAAVAWITPSVRERCPDLPTSAPAELTRFHVVDGVTQFLKRVALRSPLVLVLDNLHCADGDSLHLLRVLASELSDVPLLVVGAYRDGPASRDVAGELARVAGEPLSTVIRLAGFGMRDVQRYVAAASATWPSDALAQAIHAKTAGHPLFVAEVTRLLAADGRLADQARDVVLRVRIPETRRHAIAERLARVSEQCRNVLGVAAVIGQDFSTDLVTAVSGARRGDVVDALGEALDARLVVDGDEPEGRRFAHVLVRDVVYDGIALHERRRLHRRIVTTLTAAAADPRRGSTEPALTAAIAHHALASATDAADWRAAVGWITAAGDRAALMMAHEEAARHYTVALRAMEDRLLPSPAEMTDVLVRLAEAEWRAGATHGAREAGRRAIAFAKRTHDHAAIAAAALAFAGRLPGFGAIVSDPEVIRELESALALVPESSPAPRARLMARLAEELACAPGRYADRSLASRAIELARAVDDPAVLAAVLRTTHWSVWTPDAVERRRALALEIVTLAQRIGDRVLALDGQLLQLWSTLEHGDTESAWQQLDVCTRLEQDLRLPHYAWVTGAARACLLRAAGRLDDAQRVAADAFANADQREDPTLALIMGAQRAYVNARFGRFDEVATWLHQVLTTFPMLTSTVECVMVLASARMGDVDRARSALAAFAEDEFTSIPWNAMWLLNMTFLAEACTGIGDAELAARLYPRLLPFARYTVVLPPIFVQGPVAHYLGALAALTGDEVRARRHYEAALALEQRMGLSQWLAPTQIAYGQLLARSPTTTDTARGVKLVACGRALAQRLGLSHVVRDADVALEAPPARHPGGAVFRRSGALWELEFRGRRTTVPDRVGMRYLHCLLQRPGVSIAALQLASLGADAMLIDGTGGLAVDRRAMAEVKHRLAELEAATSTPGATGLTPDALHERAECEAYITGVASELVSAADRARSGVTKAISRALRAIRAVDDAFAHHLERHVETGRLCTYVPDPASPLTFEL